MAGATVQVASEEDPGVSALGSFVLIVSYILGLGVLLMPKIFLEGGMLLSALVLLLVTCATLLMVNYYLEVMYRAECLLRLRGEWGGSSDGQEGAEDAPALHVGDLCAFYSGPKLRQLWGAVLTVYLVVGHWGMTVAATQTFTGLVGPLWFKDGRDCLGVDDLKKAYLFTGPCVNLYHVCLLLYAVAVTCLACLELKKQVGIQKWLTFYRVLALLLSILLSLVGLIKQQGLDGTPLSQTASEQSSGGLPAHLWNLKGFPLLFATAVFSQITGSARHLTAQNQSADDGHPTAHHRSAVHATPPHSTENAASARHLTPQTKLAAGFRSAVRLRRVFTGGVADGHHSSPAAAHATRIEHIANICIANIVNNVLFSSPALARTIREEPDVRASKQDPALCTTLVASRRGRCGCLQRQRLFAMALGFTLILYCTLGALLSFVLGDDLHSLLTLNFKSFNGYGGVWPKWLSRTLSYMIFVFPLPSIVSQNALCAFTLGNDWAGIYTEKFGGAHEANLRVPVQGSPGRGQLSSMEDLNRNVSSVEEMTSSTSTQSLVAPSLRTQLVCRALAALAPCIGAIFLTDLSLVVTWAGMLAFFIVYGFPSYLQWLSLRLVGRPASDPAAPLMRAARTGRGGELSCLSRTPYSLGLFSHPWAALTSMTLALSLFTYNVVLVVTAQASGHE
eukprot:g19101.t1